ncbi:DUF6108 family protein [Phocaeicola paurosaccharolyticus]|jgi:hypothetical protein|uniref:DUF6108 family protein n=1 Tax=Phocaeicola paurosaccharolyticus TaxID=732242 RepID=UPI0005534266|nr:DUF6108 family protein [Phocaeicola paurosaccharolyticus]
MIKRIILLMLLVSLTMGISAQEGLGINQLFGNRYRNNRNAIEVLVKGKELKDYDLSLFRSLTVKYSPDEAKVIEKLVTADAKDAVDKETGRIGGNLYFGFYQLQPAKGKHRYIFFRNNFLRKNQEPEVTIVYMEGNTTLKELKNLFK